MMAIYSCCVTFVVVNLSFSFMFLRGVDAVCHGTEAPKDGWRSDPDKDRFETGSVIKYHCKTNYTLDGSPKVICLGSGEWDAKVPRCIDPCGVCQNGGKCVHQPKTGLYTCLCMEGFRGRRCDIPVCTKPNEVWNGGFFVKSPIGVRHYDVGSELIFNCNKGYVVKGSNYDIKCILDQSGGARWSRAFPVCTARKCKNLLEGEKLPNGKFTPNKAEYAIRDIVKFTCVAGFELHGSSFVTCFENGLWSSVSWPRCFPKNCLAPPALPNGRVIQPGGKFPAGTVISFECRTGEGYYRFGPRRQTCNPTSNGEMVWTPKRPVCVTRIRFEEYCVRQGKVMTMNPEPSCVRKISVKGDATTTRRSASIDTLTIVTGTAGGLLGFLLVIIAFVICQRRRMMRRMRLATSRRARSLEDERMLIYCSNDFHFFLPSYDEAIRSRPPEPPPFEAVVNNAERTSQAAGQTSTVQNETSADSSNSSDPIGSENQYETIDNVTVSPQPSQTTTLTTSPSEPVYSTIERGARSQASNEDTEVNVENEADTVVNETRNEEKSSPCREAAIDRRCGSVSSQDSTTDENQPLM